MNRVGVRSGHLLVEQFLRVCGEDALRIHSLPSIFDECAHVRVHTGTHLVEHVDDGHSARAIRLVPTILTLRIIRSHFPPIENGFEEQSDPPLWSLQLQVIRKLRVEGLCLRPIRDEFIWRGRCSDFPHILTRIVQFVDLQATVLACILREMLQVRVQYVAAVPKRFVSLCACVRAFSGGALMWDFYVFHIVP